MLLHAGAGQRHRDPCPGDREIEGSLEPAVPNALRSAARCDRCVFGMKPTAAPRLMLVQPRDLRLELASVLDCRACNGS